MNPIVVVVIAALATLYPGYLLGKRAQGHPRRYQVLFYGSLVVMVAVLSWALITEQDQVAGLALGCGFGLANGARHGYTQVFRKLRDAEQEGREQG